MFFYLVWFRVPHCNELQWFPVANAWPHVTECEATLNRKTVDNITILYRISEIISRIEMEALLITEKKTKEKKGKKKTLKFRHKYSTLVIN